jgi:hypothetical protein
MMYWRWRAIILGGAVIGLAACERPATAPGVQAARGAPPSMNAASGNNLNVYGPDSIYSSGTYRYTATWIANYVDFQWANRACDVLDVASCTSEWIPIYNVVVQDAYTEYHDHFVPADCSGGGTKSYQIRVYATAFGTPPQTKYKVTKKCAELP